MTKEDELHFLMKGLHFAERHPGVHCFLDLLRRGEGDQFESLKSLNAALVKSCKERIRRLSPSPVAREPSSLSIPSFREEEEPLLSLVRGLEFEASPLEEDEADKVNGWNLKRLRSVLYLAQLDAGLARLEYQQHYQDPQKRMTFLLGSLGQKAVPEDNVRKGDQE